MLGLESERFVMLGIDGATRGASCTRMGIGAGSDLTIGADSREKLRVSGTDGALNVRVSGADGGVNVRTSGVERTVSRMRGRSGA